MQRERVLHSAGLNEELHGLIEGSELGGVDDRVSHDVGENADPKAANSISRKRLLVAVERTIVSPLLFGQDTLCLEADLDHISRVGDHDSESA